jgi:outer membrane protein insertion porin family
MIRCCRHDLSIQHVLLLWLPFFLLISTVFPHGALGEKGPDTTLLMCPLAVYGPPEAETLAGEVAKGLAQRLRAAGHTVIVSSVPCPSPGEAMEEMTRRHEARFVLYGSLSRVGPHLSIDLRLVEAGRKAQTPHPVFVEGLREDLIALLDQMEQKIDRVLMAPYLVAVVDVKGNRRVDSDAILRVANTRTGAPYERATAAEDIKAIYKLGFFDDVQVDVKDGPDGRHVTFLVREKPAIRNIRLSGHNEISEEKIRDVMDLKPFAVIQDTALQENASKIEALYAEKGYVGTTVVTSTEPVSEEVTDVTFEIQEGEKVQIKSISFEGNHAFDDGGLKDLMETTEKSPLWLPTWRNLKALFGGDTAVLKWDALDRDLGRVAAFYHNNGYVDARVGSPQVRREGTWIFITIPVEEGERYRVGQVSIEQDLFEDEEDLLDRLEIPGRDVYSQEILRQDILKLTDLWADEGFAYAEVNPVLDKNTERRLVNITLVVSKGPKIYFERIEIVGNTRTRDKVIRRELRVKELEPFSASGLRKSNQRLKRLGYFDDVSLTPTRGSEEDKMDLRLEVKERSTGMFSIGAGYSSVDKLILMGEISQRNLLGRGQTLSFNGIIGAETSRYSLSFTEPYLFDTRFSFGIDAYNWERDYDDYTKSSTGGASRIGYPIGDDLNVFVGLRNTTLSNVSDDASSIILESMDIHTTRSVSLGLGYDTRDDYYNPTTGWKNSVSLEYAGGPLSGDSAYIKLEGTVSYFHPIWKDLVGHIRGGMGYVTEGSNGRLPVYERFFLGGIDSVRGFKYGRISPVDPETDERIGGERMGYVQLETIFPLVKDAGLNGVCFLDMGNVWEEDVGYDLGDMRKSIGFGIRWLSPMGPLRIEWGYNIDVKPGDDKSNWEFRIGGPF